MQEKIKKTKTLMYLLLVVLTAACAFLSYTFYESDVASRTMPQITRAMTQISKLIPQLEENEQAVRDAYNDLQDSRQRVYTNNAGALAKHNYSGENAETVIDNTLSWTNRVTMLRVGHGGHVIVVSKKDNTILAHPDEQFVGEKLLPIGNVDLDAIPDVSAIDENNVAKRFQGFFPMSFFSEQVSPERFYEATEAGVYGTAVSYGDTYILCGITVYEAIIDIDVRCLVTTLLFFLFGWVFVRYIGFYLAWHKGDWESFSNRLTVYTVAAISMLFVATWYYQTIMNMSGDLAMMNNHAKVAVDNLNTYKEYRAELTEWLNNQYLEQCRLAADLIKNKGKENLSRQDLAQFANELNVKYIYVLDKDGKVILTNSPYDHFEISNDPEDQSYAFRPLLDGREYVIQNPQEDELSGEAMQYVGVSLRNEEDLADGFVQIAVDPALRERTLAPINVQTVLDNMVIGLPDYALAVDKNSGEVVATTGLIFEESKLEDLGIEIKKIKGDYNGCLDIKGVTYYVGASESDDLYLIPIARSTDNTNAFLIAVKLAIFNAAAFILIAVTALHSYKKIIAVRESGGAQEEVAGKPEDDGEKGGFFSRLREVINVQEKFGFNTRWNKRSTIPIEQQTPEMRTGAIIHTILLVFAIMLTLYEMYMISMGIYKQSIGGISYVLFGNWEKGFNLFSLTYCLLLMCTLYFISELINWILYHIARVSSLQSETIFLLLRNAFKYALALVFLYVSLAKFGVDTGALWASAGVLSLIVGIGSKDLIGDVVAGLFIIFEGTYKIGDYILVGDWFGEVQEIGLRYTKIAWIGDTKIINNSAIREIVNYDGAVAREVIKVPLPYKTDLAEVEKLLDRELPKIAESIPGLTSVPIYQGVNSYEDDCIMLRIAIFCTQEVRRRAFREMQRQIKLLFDREHITMSYKQVVVREYKEDEGTYDFVPEDAAEVEEAE